MALTQTELLVIDAAREAIEAARYALQLYDAESKVFAEEAREHLSRCQAAARAPSEKESLQRLLDAPPAGPRKRGREIVDVLMIALGTTSGSGSSKGLLYRVRVPHMADYDRHGPGRDGSISTEWEIEDLQGTRCYSMVCAAELLGHAAQRADARCAEGQAALERAQGVLNEAATKPPA